MFSYKKVVSLSLIVIFLNFEVLSAFQISLNSSKPTIAVLNFQSNTGDEAIDAMLSTGTPETIITDLSNISEIQLVERRKILDTMDEIKLGLSGLIDNETAQKAGMILGSQYILVGNWQKFGYQYRVNARLIKVETTEIIIGIKETGPESSIFEIQDKISEKILSKLEINLNLVQRAKIRENETISLNAYKEYSQGLKKYDSGSFEESQQHMRKAIEYDPDYSKPKKYLFTFHPVGGGSEDKYKKVIVASNLQEAKQKYLLLSIVGPIPLGAFLGHSASGGNKKAMWQGAAIGAIVGLIFGYFTIQQNPEGKETKKK